MAKFKALQVGQQVHLVSYTYIDSKYGYFSEPMLGVGAVGTITALRAFDKAVRLDGHPYLYHRKDLEILSEDAPESVLTTESGTLKVDASTPIGTKVRVLQDPADGYYKAGAVGTLGRRDGGQQPRVDFLDDFWYPFYSNLEIVPQDTPDTVCKPESKPEPVAAPKELTIKDFVVTRVRVLSTGAKGTVIGVTGSAVVGVQLDIDVSGGYHSCAPQLGAAQGATGRCLWYSVPDLEIITEEV